LWFVEVVLTGRPKRGDDNVVGLVDRHSSYSQLIGKVATEESAS
jgi:hypothetical protein